MSKPLPQLLDSLTDDEWRSLEWAIWFGIGYLRTEAKSFKFPNEQNAKILQGVRNKLFPDPLREQIEVMTATVEESA